MTPTNLLHKTITVLSEAKSGKPINGDIILATIVYPYSSKLDTLGVGVYKDGSIIYYDDSYRLSPLKVTEVHTVLGHFDSKLHEDDDEATFYEEELTSFVRSYFKHNDLGLSLREVLEEEVQDSVIFASFRGFLELLVSEDPDDYEYPVLKVMKK